MENKELKTVDVNELETVDIWDEEFGDDFSPQDIVEFMGYLKDKYELHITNVIIHNISVHAGGEETMQQHSFIEYNRSKPAVIANKFQGLVHYSMVSNPETYVLSKVRKQHDKVKA